MSPEIITQYDVPVHAVTPAVFALMGIFFMVGYPIMQMYLIGWLQRRAAARRRRRSSSSSPTMRVRTR